MGRLEAFALGNGVWKSFLDGIGNAAGYGIILIIVAFFRELLGSGKLWVSKLFQNLYIGWVTKIMVSCFYRQWR